MKLRRKAIAAAQRAYAPYSRIKIGCAIKAKKKIYSGGNVENASYGLTICAERSAAVQAVQDGATSFEQIYIYSKQGYPPCGACLQVLAEFSSPHTEIILGNPRGEKSYLLKDLLPHLFSLENRGIC